MLPLYTAHILDGSNDLCIAESIFFLLFWKIGDFFLSEQN